MEDDPHSRRTRDARARDTSNGTPTTWPLVISATRRLVSAFQAASTPDSMPPWRLTRIRSTSSAATSSGSCAVSSTISSNVIAMGTKLHAIRSRGKPSVDSRGLGILLMRSTRKRPLEWKRWRKILADRACESARRIRCDPVSADTTCPWARAGKTVRRTARQGETSGSERVNIRPFAASRLWQIAPSKGRFRVQSSSHKSVACRGDCA